MAMSEKDLQTLSKNSHFSEKEIKNWHGEFMKKHPDGKVGREEFSTVFDQLFPNAFKKKYPKGNPAAFREHVFRVCDRDKNGVIDFKEVVQAMDVMCYGTPTDKLDLTFRMFDVNSNGTIEISEMTAVFRAIYEMTGGDTSKVEEHSKQVFSKMDLNKDGKITKDEFVTKIAVDAAVCEMFA